MTNVSRKISLQRNLLKTKDLIEIDQLILRKGKQESYLHILIKILAYIYFWDVKKQIIIEPKSIGRYKSDLISYQDHEIPTIERKIARKSNPAKWS